MLIAPKICSCSCVLYCRRSQHIRIARFHSAVVQGNPSHNTGHVTILFNALAVPERIAVQEYVTNDQPAVDVNEKVNAWMTVIDLRYISGVGLASRPDRTGAEIGR